MDYTLMLQPEKAVSGQPPRALFPFHVDTKVLKGDLGALQVAPSF